MYDNFDYEQLDRDLKDYFGTAATSGMPMAFLDLSEVESASPDEKIRIAQENGFDLGKYIRE